MVPICHETELQCDRRGQALLGHQIGLERFERRTGECAGHAQQRSDAEQGGEGDRAGPGEPAQAQAAQVASSASAAPGRSSGGRCGRRASRRTATAPAAAGTAPRRSSPSWNAASLIVTVSLGDVVDLPADHDHHRHLRDRRRQPGQPESSGRPAILKRFGERGSPRRD